jgi:hypothetical protein
MLFSRKMFNFFGRKDIRKILKRKDSDAGQKGSYLLQMFLVLFYSSFLIEFPSVLFGLVIWVFFLMVLSDAM